MVRATVFDVSNGVMVVSVAGRATGRSGLVPVIRRSSARVKKGPFLCRKR
jgi:hypothetical protein